MTGFDTVKLETYTDTRPRDLKSANSFKRSDTLLLIIGFFFGIVIGIPVSLAVRYQRSDQPSPPCFPPPTLVSSPPSLPPPTLVSSPPSLPPPTESYVIAKTYPTIDSFEIQTSCQWEYNGDTFDLAAEIAECASNRVNNTFLQEDDWRLSQSSYGITVMSNGTIFVKISHENITESMCTSDEFLSCMQTGTTNQRRLQSIRRRFAIVSATQKCPRLLGLQVDVCTKMVPFFCRIVNKPLILRPAFYRTAFSDYGIRFDSVIFLFQLGNEFFNVQVYWSDKDLSSRGVQVVKIPPPLSTGTWNILTKTEAYKIDTTTN